MNNIGKDKEVLNTYIEYIKKKKGNINYEGNSDEINALKEIALNKDLYDIFNQINTTLDYNKQKEIINNYINKKLDLERKNNLKDNNKLKDLIGETYGINVKNIEELQTKDGKILFTFFDEKLGRKRIIENLEDDKNLNELLKNDVNEDEKIRNIDYNQVAKDALLKRADANSNRQELNMVDINEFIKNPREYININEDKYYSKDKDKYIDAEISYIFNMKDKYNIKYVNFYDGILLDENNNVIEMSMDKEGNISLNNPKKWQSNVDEMNNEDNLETSIDVDTNDNKISNNNFEDEENLIKENEITDEMSIYNIKNITIKEVKQNLIEYYNNPNKLDTINDPVEKEFYTNLVDIYSERINKNNLLKNDKTKKLEYTYNNSGSINILMVTLLLIGIVIIFYIITLIRA